MNHKISEYKTEYNRQYRLKNREKLIKYCKEWRERKLGRPKLREWKNVLVPSMISPSFELGYVLGALYGDGCIFVGKIGGHGGIAVTDKDFADFFKLQLSKIYPFNIKETKRLPKGISKKIFFHIRFGSHDFAEFLDNYDLTQLKNQSKEMQKGFLKGFFDSEGCISASNLTNLSKAIRRIQFTQKNLEWIKIVQELLLEFSITSILKSTIGSGFKKEETYYYLRIFGLDNLIKFRQNIGFSIQRKSEKLDLAISSFITEKKCLDCSNIFEVRSSRHFRCDECNIVYWRKYNKEKTAFYRKRNKEEQLCELSL